MAGRFIPIGWIDLPAGCWHDGRGAGHGGAEDARRADSSGQETCARPRLLQGRSSLGRFLIRTTLFARVRAITMATATQLRTDVIGVVGAVAQNALNNLGDVALFAGQ